MKILNLGLQMVSDLQNFRYLKFLPNKKENLEYDNIYYEIYEGYHSFVNKDDCKIDKNYNNYNNLNLFIIPKGSEYYEGISSSGFTNYVSNNIIYIGRDNYFNRLILHIFYGI